MLRVIINDKELKEFNSVTLALKYDSVASTFSIKSGFDSDNEDLKKLFKPLSYQRVEIWTQDDKLLTGTVTKTTINSEANPGGITITGYSKTGVLMDCEIPEESYPLQQKNKSIKDIITTIISPFGLELHVNNNVKELANTIVEDITASSSDKCASFIVKLCQQYGIIVGHTRNGRLLLTKNRTDEKSRSSYIEGNGDYITSSLSTDGQQMYSKYTAKKQADALLSNDSSSEEVITSKMVKTFRPTQKTQTSGNKKNTENTAKAMRAKAYSSITFNLTLNSHRFQDGTPIKPNRIIALQSKEIYISNKLFIFVRDVSLKSDSKGDTAILNCILPEALTGEEINIVWQ